MPTAKVALHFADGSTIDSWERVTIRSSFLDPLDDFTFEAKPTRDRGEWDRYRSLLAKGELVTLLINDTLQGSYIITTSERTYSDSGCAIEVTLKSPLATPYEGDIDPDISLSSANDVSVNAAILKALLPYGFSVISADTRASVSAISGKPIGGRPQVVVKDLKHRDAVGHEGETAYAFCARIVTRLGCVLRMQPDGSLSVSAPDYTQEPLYTVVMSTSGLAIPNADYFYGRVRVHETNDGQFSEVTVRGQRPVDPDQAQTARPHGSVKAVDVLPHLSAYHSTLAPYKPKFFKDKSAADPLRSANVAHFELGMRAAQAYYVEGEVDGWVSAGGAIWTPNTCGRVVVEPEDLDAVMWLSEVTRHQSSDGGQYTRLHWIPLGALILGDPKRG